MQTNKFYLKKTATLSVPLVGSRLLHAANDFINMIIIAKLGIDALAAGSLIAATSATILLVSWAMLFSVAVVVGYSYGAKQFSEVGKILKSGCVLALAIGICASIVMWNANHILALFRQSQNSIALAMPYFHILALGIIPSLICVCFNEFAIGINKTYLVIIWRFLSTPINIFLSYGLVLGKFGLPKIGIMGAALGYTITYWGLAIAIFIYFSYAKNYRIYCFAAACSTYQYIKKLFTIGWPISIQLGAIMASYTAFSYMMGWLGKPALAACQIISQYAIIVAMIPYGISQTSSALTSQAFGTNKKDIHLAGFAGIYLGATTVFLLSLVYWFMPKTLISVYLNINDPQNALVISLTILFLYVNAAGQIFDAISVCTLGALRGLHDTKIPMAISITASWLISVPIAYVLTFKCNLIFGINLGFALGSIFNAVCLIVRFKRGASSYVPLSCLNKSA